ncbi:hypothetical protein Tco_0408412 [Tanacetum coccineum]
MMRSSSLAKMWPHLTDERRYEVQTDMSVRGQRWQCRWRLRIRYKQKDKDRRIMGLAATGPVELWRCWPHQSSVWYVSEMPQVSSLKKSHRMPGMSTR